MARNSKAITDKIPLLNSEETKDSQCEVKVMFQPTIEKQSYEVVLLVSEELRVEVFVQNVIRDLNLKLKQQRKGYIMQPSAQHYSVFLGNDWTL